MLGEFEQLDAAHKSGDSHNSWFVEPVYEDGCTIKIDQRGVIIISQDRLMEREQSVELTIRELVELMRLLPDVLRAAQTHGMGND